MASDLHVTSHHRSEVVDNPWSEVNWGFERLAGVTGEMIESAVNWDEVNVEEEAKEIEKVVREPDQDETLEESTQEIAGVHEQTTISQKGSQNEYNLDPECLIKSDIAEDELIKESSQEMAAGASEHSTLSAKESGINQNGHILDPEPLVTADIAEVDNSVNRLEISENGPESSGSPDLGEEHNDTKMDDLSAEALSQHIEEDQDKTPEEDQDKTPEEDFADFDDFDDFEEPEPETTENILSNDVLPGSPSTTSVKRQSTGLSKPISQLLDEIFGDYKLSAEPNKETSNVPILDVPPRSEITLQWSTRKLYNQFQRPTRQFVSVSNEDSVLKWPGSAVEEEVVKILKHWRELRYKKSQSRSFGWRNSYGMSPSSRPSSPASRPGSPSVSAFPKEVDKHVSSNHVSGSNSSGTHRLPANQEVSVNPGPSNSTQSRVNRPPALTLSNRPIKPSAFSPQTPRDIFTVFPARPTAKPSTSSAPVSSMTPPVMASAKSYSVPSGVQSPTAGVYSTAITSPSIGTSPLVHTPILTAHAHSHLDSHPAASPSLSPVPIASAHKSLPPIPGQQSASTSATPRALSPTKPAGQVIFGPVALSTKQELESDEALVKRIVSSLPDLSFLTR